jgi:hypothetical protein
VSVGESCIVCGKPRRDVNPLFVVQLHPLVCSAQCVQRAFDEEGVTFHFPDGRAIVVEPGSIEVIVDHGYPVYEGEWPSQRANRYRGGEWYGREDWQRAARRNHLARVEGL